MSTRTPVILGTELLEHEQAHVAQRQRTGTGTGIRSIDEDALLGGFEHGRISALSGTSACGKTWLALSTLATYLLTREGRTAWIDTSSTFSPSQLRDILVDRMHGTRGLRGTAAEETATKLLDRVSVMRVFDLYGVVEALGELRDSVQSRTTPRKRKRSPESAPEVLDSQGSGESEPEVEVTSAAMLPPVGLLVVDNITNVVSALLSKNHVQGLALLTTSMRSLSSFVAESNVLALLLNNAVSVHAQQTKDPQVSLFASTSGKPALGKTFLSCADTHVFLSRVPKTRDDAEAAYAGNKTGRRWEGKCVFEIIQDRHGGRYGKWAGYEYG